MFQDSRELNLVDTDKIAKKKRNTYESELTITTG